MEEKKRHENGSDMKKKIRKELKEKEMKEIKQYEGAEKKKRIYKNERSGKEWRDKEM